jgi:hypothetical protein
MNTLFAEAGSPTKTHKIKLYEKEIKVQLIYSSPNRPNKENRNNNGNTDFSYNK